MNDSEQYDSEQYDSDRRIEAGQRSGIGQRRVVERAVREILPFDELEREHRESALEWIASGAELCRLAPPDVPPMHLVSYVVAVDVDARAILLVDHRKAGLWLPAGGHVEPGEAPLDTAQRESFEELGVDAVPLDTAPLFITITQTVGSTAGHTDVSLWYLMEGDAGGQLPHDGGEFTAARWFALDALPVERGDPHLWRFAAKLRRRLEARQDLSGVSLSANSR